MINFNTKSFNPFADFKVRIKGIDDINSKANSANATSKNANSNTTNSSVNSSQNSSTNIDLSVSVTNKFLVTDKSQAVGTSLGYGIDKDGYFTSDFNEAAGIPSDYKIHSSTMESLVRVHTNRFESVKYYNSIDIAKSVGNAYKILSQVVGDNVLNSKESFSKDEIAQFPQGYEINHQSTKVLKVYNTLAEFWDAAQRYDNEKGFQRREGIWSLFRNYSDTKPATNIFDNYGGGKEDEWYWATTASKYTNTDGTISKGGLLIGIMNHNYYTIEDETTKLGKFYGLDKSLNYAQMMTAETKLESATQESGSDDEWLKNYKSPLMQMLENLIKLQKELAKKALERQRESAKKVDIKA